MLAEPDARASSSGRLGARIAAFVGVAALVGIAAADHGTYGVVARQQDALVLWWAIAVAAAVGAVPRTRLSPLGAAVVVGLLALLAWTAASLQWTSSDERTTIEIARVAAHLSVVVLVATALGPETWRAGVAGATVAAVGICLYSLATRLDPGFLGTGDAVAAFAGTRRLSVPLDYWNAVGAWAGMTTALTLALSAHVQRSAVRALCVAALPVSIVVSYLTFSRASVGGSVLGLLVVLAASRNRWTALAHAGLGAAGGAAAVLAVRAEPAIESGASGDGGGHVALVILAAAVVVGTVAAVLGRIGVDRLRLTPVVARRTFPVFATALVLAVAALAVADGRRAYDSFTQTRTPTAVSAARLGSLSGTRHLIFRVAADSFADHPFDGTGAGTFEFTWNRAALDGESVKDAHSLYLETMSELGVPGLIFLLLFVLSAVGVLARRVRRSSDVVDRGYACAAAGGVAAYLLGAGVDWLWESTAVTVLALALVGCVMAGDGRPARASRAVRLGLVAAALVLGALELPGLVSSRDAARSGDAIAAGDLAGAARDADSAVAAEPWAASPYVQRALVREQRGDLPHALGDLDLARAREPLNWRIPLLAARVEAKLGDADASLADIHTARSLRPLGGFFGAG